MDPNNTFTTEPPAKSKKPLIIAIVAVAVLIAGTLGWKTVSSAVAQPGPNDFTHLDNQRKALDTSVEAYGHMLSEYSRTYTNAYLEDRSTEEKDAIKERAMERFEQESKIGQDRLKRMASSVAMKDDSVKTKFDEFKKQYESVFAYYEARLSGVTNITGSVAGPCAQLTKLNVAKENLADNYIKAADTCLTALENAKQGSDKQVTTLLGEVEKMVREQREHFEAVTKAEEGLEKNATKLQALALMLQINSRVAAFQSAYEQSVKQQYNQLASSVNAANAALEQANGKRLATLQTTETVVRR